MNRLAKFIFSFIPKSLQEKGGEALAEAKVFLIVGLTGIPLMLIFTLSYWAAGNSEIAISCGISFLTAVLSLPIFYITSSPTIGNSMLIISGYFALVVGSFWADGIHAPGVFWFINAQILGVLILKRRTAIFWWLFYLASGVALAYPALFGLKVVNTLSETDFNQFKLMGLFGSSLLGVSIALSVRTQKDRMQTDITKRNEALSESLQQNSSLIRMLSHDIANSITVIELSTKSIGAGKNPETNLQRIKKVVQNMSDLVLHVREQQALVAGKVEPILTELDFVTLIEQSVDLLREKLDAKKVKVEFSYDNTQRYLGLAESISAINVVFCNILSNAIKFSTENSTIQISISNFKNKIKVEIADEGIGIPQSILANLFNFSASTTRPGTAGEKGTGFGMPLVKTYMESFGGSIQVSSQINVDQFSKTRTGTTVTLLFQRQS